MEIKMKSVIFKSLILLASISINAQEASYDVPPVYKDDSAISSKEMETHKINSQLNTIENKISNLASMLHKEGRYFINYSALNFNNNTFDFESERATDYNDNLNIDTDNNSIKTFSKKIDFGFQGNGWGFLSEIDFTSESEDTEFILHSSHGAIHIGGGIGFSNEKVSKKYKVNGSVYSEREVKATELSLIFYLKNDLIDNEFAYLNTEFTAIGSSISTTAYDGSNTIKIKLIGVEGVAQSNFYYKAQKDFLVGAGLSLGYGRLSGKVTLGSTTEKGFGNLWSYGINLLQVKKFF